MEPHVLLRMAAAILRRRLLLLVLVSTAVAILAAVGISFLPVKYQSTARILVESQQIPPDLARSTVTSNAAERVQVLQQRILTRDNLLALARKHQLYGQDSDISPSDRVDAMRAAIKVTQISVGTGTRAAGQTIAFTLSFDYMNPLVASRVTSDLVNLMLQQNIEARTRRATETSRFFSQQVSRLHNELAALESDIARFKRDNEAALPEGLATRRALLAQTQSELAQTSARIREAEEARRALDRDRIMRTASAGGEGQLVRLNAQLSDLQAKHHELHPAVRAVKNQIAALERAADLDTQLRELTEVRNTLQQRYTTLEQGIQRAPQVDLALSSMSRKYNDVQVELSQARSKLADAEIGERLEADRQAERFDVIEQASVPSAPTGPPRALLYLGAVFAGLVGGLGVIGAAEFLNPRIRTGDDLIRRLEIRPLAVVPYVVTRFDRARARRNAMAGLVGVAALALGLGIAVHMLYSPLPDLLGRLAARLG